MSYPYKAQLEILGVERVKKGMPAFDRAPCMDARTCFLGTAGVWDEWVREANERHGGLMRAPIDFPIFVLSSAYERRPDELRQSCVLFLAEHGEAIEPSVGVAGKADGI